MEREYWKWIDRLEADSFRELMLTYGQDVWNYAYLLTGNPTTADDVSQDVFLRVFRSIAKFRGESHIRTWLLTITRHVAINYRRTAFVRKVMLVDRPEPRDTHPSAESEAISVLQIETAWAIVMKLPLKFREVLVLDAKFGYTSREIAQMLGISEGTVKSRLSRARSKASATWEGETLHEGI